MLSELGQMNMNAIDYMQPQGDNSMLATAEEQNFGIDEYVDGDEIHNAMNFSMNDGINVSMGENMGI